jgi:trimeric autotransporter adhesin
VFQTGSGTTGKIGIDTITPATQLDVNGAGTIRGTLSLPATGSATATGGKTSQGLNLVASSFSSTSSTALNQVFRWQAEPVGNDTTAPSGTLNLQYGLGATTPSETGLKISSKGLLTFATGQTFPGVGAGTITGITTAAGSGLAGGGVKGTLTLSVPAAGITNAMLAHPSLTVAPGTGLTGGGVVALGDSVTLNVNTAKIPQLGAANTFVGNQTVTGTVAATSSTNTIVGTSTGTSSAGVYGSATTPTGSTIGVLGQSSSTAGYGVEGTSAGIGVYGTGSTGVSGQSSSATGGIGVSGYSPFMGVYGVGLLGVSGYTSSTTGTGVYGIANVATGTPTGVGGTAQAPSGYGVSGTNTAKTGNAVGVYGSTQSVTGYGVQGIDAASSGGSAGFFQVNSGSATILQGNNGSSIEFKVDSAGDVTAAGVVSASGLQIEGTLFDYGYPGGNSFVGFAGNTTMTGLSNFGAGYGALAFNTTGLGNTATGVSALFNNCSATLGSCGFSQGNLNTANGGNALNNNSTGSANTGIGYNAGETFDSSSLTGFENTALGFNALFSTGTLSNSTVIGANAEVTESNALVLGGITGVNGGTSVNVGIGTTAPTAALDVEGNNVQTLIGDPGCGSGFAGIGFVGAGGFNSCSNYALIGDRPGDVYLNSSLSGTFFFRNNNNSSSLMTIDSSGNVSIKGNLSKGGGSFKIDHPLDPVNKYLYHSFVESPDMMNIYNGVIVLDANGEAVVGLPDWFEALNRDFRYQLTPVGAPGPNLYIAEEVASNQFKIAGGKPGSKVSWQVTGIRQDAYANAYRIPTEEEKPPQERGHYLHPELFGAPAESRLNGPAIRR